MAFSQPDEGILQILKLFYGFDLHRLSLYLSFRSLSFYRETQTGKGVPPWVATVITSALHFYTNGGGQDFESKRFEIDDAIMRAVDVLHRHYDPRVGSLETIETDALYFGIAPMLLQQHPHQMHEFIPAYRYFRLFKECACLSSLLLDRKGVTDYLPYACISRIVRPLSDALLSSLPPDVDFRLSNEQYEKCFVKFYSCLDRVLSIWPMYVKSLAVSVDDFRKKQSEYCDMSSTRELLFSYKVLDETPFLKYAADVTLLQSSFLSYACTDGLFLSVTDFVSKRDTDKIGHALGHYVSSLVEENGMYEMPSRPTDDYMISNRARHGPEDVVFRDDQTIVFVEVKKLAHGRKTWTNDPESIRKEYRKVVEKGAKQLIDNYRNYMLGKYSPFGEEDKRDRKCILVLAMLFYMPMDINKVAGDLSEAYGLSEAEKDMLLNNFVIVDFYSLETQLIFKQDLMRALNYCLDNNVDFSQNCGTSLLSMEQAVSSFRSFVSESGEMTIRAMSSCGLFPKN